MSLNPIPGLSAFITGRIYSKTGPGDMQNYKLNASQQGKELEKLEMKLVNGQISEQEYNHQKALIESAPLYVHVENGYTESGNENIFEREEKQHLQEIDRLEQQYKNGEISDFMYKANMYLLNNPELTDTSQQCKFSTTA